MRILVGLTTVCVFLLGFGTAVWWLDRQPASSASSEFATTNALGRPAASTSSGEPVDTVETASVGTGAAQDNITSSTAVSGPTPGDDQTESKLELDQKPPLAISMPSIGLYGASARADWLTGSDAGQPEQIVTAAARGADLYEVERPKRAFYTLAVAEFAHLESARTLKRELQAQSIDAEIFSSGTLAGQDWYTVAVGRFADRPEADRQSRRLSPRIGRRLSPVLLRLSPA